VHVLARLPLIYNEMLPTPLASDAEANIVTVSVVFGDVGLTDAVTLGGVVSGV
jgi:hypothetical protein